jgi:hypothetical protein
MRVLAIDPGPEKSAFLLWDNGVVFAEHVTNDQLRTLLRENLFGKNELVAIEMIASYGMAVGKETFETCVWIGRFIEMARPVRTELVYRKDVKMHLCGTMKAKDANIRTALIDKHGAPGTKKNQGKTYGIKSHLWSALAVADYAIENFK